MSDWRRRRRWRRRFNVGAAIAVVLVVGGGAWLGVYGHDRGLTRKWRGFVMEAFQERGIELELERLTLDPVQGLVARDVRIFEDASRQRVMAVIDRVTLDIDYQSLLQGETRINHVDLRQADAMLPLSAGEPDDDDARLQLRGLDARIHLDGDRIELRQASGSLEGIEFDVRGTLLKSRESGWTLPWLRGDEEPDDPEEQERSRERLREQLRILVAAVREIRWEPGQAAPRLQLVVTGDLEDWNSVTLDIDLECGAFDFRNWRPRSIRASARVTANEAALKNFELIDHAGRLQAWAQLRRISNEVRFAVESEIDVMAALAAFDLADWARELVLYEAPRCSLEGSWQLDQSREFDPSTGLPLALTLLGSVDGGRVVARGVVFDRFSADVSLADGQAYARNVRLQHLTGAVTGEAYRDAGGFRHRLMVQMDLTQMAPFLQVDGARSFLRQLDIDRDSVVLIASEGRGPSLDPSTWENRIEIDLRDLMLRGVKVRRLSARMETAPGGWTLNDIKLETPDGRLDANAVMDDGGLRFAASANMSPVALVPIMRLEGTRSWLRRWSNDESSSYKTLIRGTGPELDPDTWTTQIDFEAGSFTYRDEGFDSLSGTVRLSPGKVEYFDLDIARPEGSGRLVRAVHDTRTELVTVEGFSGDLDPVVVTRALAPGFAGNLTPYRFSRPPRWSLEGVIGPEDGDSDCVVTIESGGVLEYEIFGETLPFNNVGGTVTFQGSEVVFDLDGGLFGGDASAVFTIQRGVRPGIAGEVRLRGVEYGTLSRVYAPGARPEGDLTGHFVFNSVLGDARTLSGRGVAILVNGDLVSLPALGPLTPLVGALLPAPINDYSVAREASANFTVENGVFRTDDFEALTSAFRMNGSGTIDPIGDKLDFEMNVNVRGAPGLVLLPVSKLLEFQGSGSFTEPSWRPKYLPRPGAGGRGVPDQP